MVKTNSPRATSNSFWEKSLDEKTARNEDLGLRKERIFDVRAQQWLMMAAVPIHSIWSAHTHSQ
jgi:hypothetical protein